jgi:hypothetical protein
VNPVGLPLAFLPELTRRTLTTEPFLAIFITFYFGILA